MARVYFGCLIACSFCNFAGAQTLVRPPAQQVGPSQGVVGQSAIGQGGAGVRTVSDIRPLGPGAVAPSAAAAPGGAEAAVAGIPQPPEWVARMTAAELKWIDEVLLFWEQRSDKIKLFTCNFQRWDSDGGYVDPSGKRYPRMYAEGVIKYAQPDKGLYHVEKLVSLMPPTDGGTKPQEIVQNPDLGEHWICDGQQIYSFEASKKQVTVNPLPPNMQGKAIADGPLPFMFGAKAQAIQARYWIRGLAAAEGDKRYENKYWLEAVPKSRQDAQNFKMVRIVLDKAEYLPETIEIFAPNYDPPRNDARQSYLFTKRETKDAGNIAAMVATGLDPLGLFHREFFNPRIPAGWKKVVQNPPGAGPPPPPQQAGPAPAPRLPAQTLPR